VKDYIGREIVFDQIIIEARQLLLDSAADDPAAMQYAVGCVLYYLADLWRIVAAACLDGDSVDAALTQPVRVDSAAPTVEQHLGFESRLDALADAVNEMQAESERRAAGQHEHTPGGPT
jgi:hypothetical protein